MANKISLGTNSPEIEYLRKKDKRLAKVISMVGDLTYSIQTDYQLNNIWAQNESKNGAENYLGTVSVHEFHSLSKQAITAFATASAILQGTAFPI